MPASAARAYSRRMSLAVLYKLCAIFLTVAIGWVAGRMRWLGDGSHGADPARTLSNAAFHIFVPALLFRTTARLDFAALPWAMLLAFFVPTLLYLFAVHAWQRRLNTRREPARRLPAAAPAVRAISVTYGNTLQVGIPMATALFGEAGLGIHITIVSLYALVLLSVLTVLVEIDLAREHARGAEAASLLGVLATVVKNTVIHPVVLPVIAGLSWNLTGLGLNAVVDEVLQLLGTAVTPLCLVLIGISLAYYGLGGRAKGALMISVFKLLLLPALVLGVAHWGFGLSGLALSVVVMLSALPAGSNALIFAQRYRALESEATAAIVFSTLGFVITAPLWLQVLGWLQG
jgi:malonate transporter and related proteins